MSQTVAPIRGVNDVLPEEIAGWHWLESVVRGALGHTAPDTTLPGWTAGQVL